MLRKLAEALRKLLRKLQKCSHFVMCCGSLRKVAEGFLRKHFFSNLLFFIVVFSKFPRKCQIFVHQEIDNVIKIVLHFIEFAEGRTISVNKFMADCHRSNSHCVSAFCSISH